MRAAVRAAVRLGVVAAVFDVVVFPVAVRAHRKCAHRGLGPVIGHVLDDRKARAAVGAVDKGIAVTPIGRVAQLAQAVVTDADVGGNERVALRLGFALQDLEIPKVLQLGREFRLDALDDRELRRLARQIGDEALKLRPLALELQLHAGGGVLDRPGEAVGAHLLVDEGAEADALDDAVYMDQDSFQGRASSVKNNRYFSDNIIIAVWTRCNMYFLQILFFALFLFRIEITGASFRKLPSCPSV